MLVGGSRKPGSIPCKPRFPLAGWVSTEAKKDQGGLRPPRGHPEATHRLTGSQPVGTQKLPRGYPEATPRLPRSYPEATLRLPQGYPKAYSSPRVIHRSEESPQGLLPAASVNNSAARGKSLCINSPNPFPR